jgi:hypothetical protein
MGSRSKLGFLLALLAAGSMWIYVQLILIPHQRADEVATQRPRGNLSDLYPRWLGARELLRHGRDPYGGDITREIQTGYYGRPLAPSRPNDPKDQQAFAYPLYVVFLLAPTVGLPFAVVHTIFFWLLLAITAGSVLLWLKAIGWSTSCSAKLVWILLTLSSFPAVQGMKLQQLSLMVAALLAGSMCCLARRQFVWAGILLALASIKPQLVALPVLWLCIWVLGNWRDRKRALWGFLITVATLTIAGELLLPGWIGEFRTACAEYYQYTGGGKSVLDVALTPAVGRVVSVVLVGAFLSWSWRVRRAPEGSVEFQWSFSLCLAVTLVVIPMFAPYNQLLLIPAVMVIARSIRELWKKNPLTRLLVSGTALAVLFPWIGAISLVSASILIPAGVVQRAWALPLYSNFAIPVLVLALLLVTRSVLPVPRVLRQDAAAE